MEKEQKVQLTDHLELHFVQMKLSEYNERKVLPVDGTMLQKWVFFLMFGQELTYQEAIALDQLIATARTRFEEIQDDPKIMEAITMREKDDLQKEENGQRALLIRQIEKYGKRFGVDLPTQTIEELQMKKVEKLEQLVDTFMNHENLNESVYRSEIETLLQN